MQEGQGSRGPCPSYIGDGHRYVIVIDEPLGTRRRVRLSLARPFAVGTRAPAPKCQRKRDPYPRVPTEEGSPSLTADGRRTFRPSHRREGGLPSVFRAEGVSSVSGLYRLFFRGHLRTGEIGASLAGGGWPEGCIALGSLFDGGLAASGAGCPIVAENFFTATRQGQASTLHSYMNRCSYIWKMFGDPIEE